jgi:hypothetical protein
MIAYEKGNSFKKSNRYQVLPEEQWDLTSSQAELVRDLGQSTAPGNEPASGQDVAPNNNNQNTNEIREGTFWSDFERILQGGRFFQDLPDLLEEYVSINGPDAIPFDRLKADVRRRFRGKQGVPTGERLIQSLQLAHESGTRSFVTFVETIETPDQTREREEENAAADEANPIFDGVFGDAQQKRQRIRSIYDLSPINKGETNDDEQNP